MTKVRPESQTLQHRLSPVPSQLDGLRREGLALRVRLAIGVNVDTTEVVTKPWVSEKFTFKLADGKTEMREDVCVPSVEAKYKETIREPAGGAAVIKK